MADFPRRLMHGSGGYMDLDESRLLLATRESLALDDITERLNQVELVLEDADAEPDGRRLRRVNHTDTRFWVRSVERQPRS